MENSIRRSVAALATAALLLTPGASFAGDGSGNNRTTTPIKHVVVIFQENVSFDHYFGTYPHAFNLPGEIPFHAKANTPESNTLFSSGCNGLFEATTGWSGFLCRGLLERARRQRLPMALVLGELDVGDIDVENFPTLLIQHSDAVAFFGTVLPDAKLADRLILAQAEKSDVELRAVLCDER